MTNKVFKAIKRKNRLWPKFKLSNIILLYDRYKEAKKLASNLVKEAKYN